MEIHFGLTWPSSRISRTELEVVSLFLGYGVRCLMDAVFLTAKKKVLWRFNDGWTLLYVDFDCYIATGPFSSAVFMVHE
jgi:hypothetical protein